jgi:beta-lactamase regulating signal transducer with metallopeptidase domain
MTATLLGHALGNTLLAAPLAMLAWWLGRTGRHPALAHVVWVAVLVRLVMPPFAAIGWLPLRVPVPGAAVAERVAAAAAPEPAGIAGAATAALRPDAAPGAARPDSSLSDSTAAVAVPRRPLAKVDPWHAFGVLWLGGTAAIVAVSIARIVRFRRALHAGSVTASPVVLAVARRAAADLGMPLCARILSTRAGTLPFVWGLLGRPTIVLSEDTLSRSTEAELRLVLLHELAHVRRGDHLVRWLDWAAGACLWWNPLVWIARRGLRSTEELACDALVLRTRGTVPRDYGSYLLSVAEAFSGPGMAVPLQACTIGDGGSLELRLLSIMSGSHLARSSFRLRLATILAAAASLVAGIAWVPMAVSGRTSAAAQAEVPAELPPDSDEVRTLRASLDDPHALDVEVVNGSITLVRDDALAAMDVTVVVGGGWGDRGWWGKHTEAHRAAVQAAALVTKRDPAGRVTVRVDVPGRVLGITKNPPRTDVTIRTPGIAGVRAETTNGIIRTMGELGTLVLETTNGSVTVVDAVSAVRAESTNGYLDISGAMSAVQAETTNGRIRIAVADRAQPEIEADSTNGSIALQLPASWDGAVNASTAVGSIQVQGVDGTTKRRLTGATFRSGAAPGSPSKASLEVTNGSIRITRPTPR